MRALVAEHLVRSYTAGDARVAAIADVSLTLTSGDFVALIGPSGCGKSTLLHLCGGMERPTSGTVALEGRPLHELTDDDLTKVRRERVGFVFQFFNLLPTLTVLENVALPRLLSGHSYREAEAAAASLLDRVALAPRRHHYPGQLSGGEMQRAAIARALVQRPALIIADEPTGNLDSENGRAVLDLLVGLNRETGVTMLLATHAAEVAAAATRVIQMRDGRIESQRATGAAV